MAGEDKSILIIALVALVAIIAITALTLQGSTQDARILIPNDKNNTAGYAYILFDSENGGGGGVDTGSSSDRKEK